MRKWGQTQEKTVKSVPWRQLEGDGGIKVEKDAIENVDVIADQEVDLSDDSTGQWVIRWRNGGHW